MATTKTLSQLFAEQNKALPAYGSSERTQLANQAGISGYTGSAQQNATLTNYLSNQGGTTTQPQGLTSVSAVGGGTYNVPPANVQPGANSGVPGASVPPTTTPTLSDKLKNLGTPDLSLEQEALTKAQTDLTAVPTESSATQALRNNVDQAIQALKQRREGRRSEIQKSFETKKNQALASQIRSGTVGSGVDAGQNLELSGAEGQAQSLADQELQLSIQSENARLDPFLKQDDQNRVDAINKLNTLIEEKKSSISTKKKEFLAGLGQKLIAEGIDPSTLDETAINDYAKQYGSSASELKSLYNTAVGVKNKSEGELARLERQGQPASVQEYEYAKAQGYGGTYGQYQNEDANRKQAIARAGASRVSGDSSGLGDSAYSGSYTKSQEKLIGSIDDKISKNDTYKKTSNMRSYADNVQSALSLGTGAGDLAAINQFQKVIDEGAVTRDQDVKLIQGSQSLLNQLSTYGAKLQKGEQLSPELRQQMNQAVNSIYQAQVQALNKDPFVQSKKNELKRNGVNEVDTIIGGLGVYDRGTNAPAQESYNYDADVAEARDLIKKGVPRADIEAALKAKYKEVNL